MQRDESSLDPNGGTDDNFRIGVGRLLGKRYVCAASIRSRCLLQPESLRRAILMNEKTTIGSLRRALPTSKEFVASTIVLIAFTLWGTLRTHQMRAINPCLSDALLFLTLFPVG